MLMWLIFRFAVWTPHLLRRFCLNPTYKQYKGSLPSLLYNFFRQSEHLCHITQAVPFAGAEHEYRTLKRVQCEEHIKQFGFVCDNVAGVKYSLSVFRSKSLRMPGLSYRERP